MEKIKIQNIYFYSVLRLMTFSGNQMIKKEKKVGGF